MMDRQAEDNISAKNKCFQKTKTEQKFKKNIFHTSLLSALKVKSIEILRWRLTLYMTFDIL